MDSNKMDGLKFYTKLDEDDLASVSSEELKENANLEEEEKEQIIPKNEDNDHINGEDFAEYDFANRKINEEELDNFQLQNNQDEIQGEEPDEEYYLRQQEEERELKEARFNALPPAGKVAFMLENYPLNDPEFAELKTISKEVSDLYNEAHKPNADPEAMKKLAVAGLDLSLKMSQLLTRLAKEEPERFNFDGHIASLISAYNLNSNVTVEAIEGAKGQIFPELLDRTFENVVKAAREAKNNPGNASARNLETELAKAMYIAHLKRQFDLYSENDDIDKYRRAQIFNEFYSDKFTRNLNKFKENGFFKTAKEKVFGALGGNIDGKTLKAKIDEAAIEYSESIYHDRYRHSLQGFTSEDEKRRVQKEINEIDQTRELANEIGAKYGEEPELKDFNKHPVFDTVFLKKKIKLFGEQKNVIGELVQKKQDEKEYMEALGKEMQSAGIKFDDRMRALKKEYDERTGLNKEHEKINKELALLDKEMENNIKVEKTIRSATFDPNPKEDARLKKEQLDLLADRNEKIVFEKHALKEKLEKLQISDKKQDELKFIEYEKLQNPENYKLERSKAINAAREKFEKDHPGQKIEKPLISGNTAILKEERENVDYPKYVQEKNTEKLNEIKRDRYNRDNEFKKRNIEIYEPVSYNGKTVYVTRETKQIKRNLVASYKDYQREYNEYDELKERQANLDLNKFIGLESNYQEKTYVDTPNRDEYEILQFEPAGQVVIEGIDLSKIEAAQDIKGINPENIVPQPNEAVPVAQDPDGEFFDENATAADMAEELNAKVAEMDRHTAFFGTDEYTSIKQGIRDLSEALNNPDTQPAVKIKKTRVLLSRLNFYIDRKTDEKENSRRESETARPRRTAAEDARTTVKKTLNTLLRQENLLGQDPHREFNESIADMEAVMSLTHKNNDANLLGIVAELKGEDYEASVKKMWDYLYPNMPRYVNRADGKYKFRLRENEDVGKRRYIKGDNEAKVYKTVLLTFEKMENAYLKHLAENEPWKVPGAIYNVTHVGRPELNHNMKNVLGIDINTNAYKDLNMDIRPSDTIQDHIEQFENRYKYFMNKASFTNEEKKYSLKENYQAGEGVSYEDEQQMVESALSVYYLKNLESDLAVKEKQFNLDEAEEGRKKFITAVRKSSAYQDICEKCGSYFDLTNMELNNMREGNKELRQSINTTAKFKDQILTDELSGAIARDLGDAGTRLTAEGTLMKTLINRDMDDVGINLKIAKVLGISSTVQEKAQEKVDSPLVGENFEATMKKTGDLFTKKTVAKKEEITRGVNHIKL